MYAFPEKGPYDAIVAAFDVEPKPSPCALLHIVDELKLHAPRRVTVEGLRGIEFQVFLQDGCVHLACPTLLAHGIDVRSKAPLPTGKDADALHSGFKTYTLGHPGGCISTALFDPTSDGCKVVLHVDLPVHPFWYHADGSHVEVENAIRAICAMVPRVTNNVEQSNQGGFIRYLPRALMERVGRGMSSLLTGFHAKSSATHRLEITRTFTRTMKF